VKELELKLKQLTTLTFFAQKKKNKKQKQTKERGQDPILTP